MSLLLLEIERHSEESSENKRIKSSSNLKKRKSSKETLQCDESILLPLYHCVTYNGKIIKIKQMD